MQGEENKTLKQFIMLSWGRRLSETEGEEREKRESAYLTPHQKQGGEKQCVNYLMEQKQRAAVIRLNALCTHFAFTAFILLKIFFSVCP